MTHSAFNTLLFQRARRRAAKQDSAPLYGLTQRVWSGDPWAAVDHQWYLISYKEQWCWEASSFRGIWVVFGSGNEDRTDDSTDGKTA